MTFILQSPDKYREEDNPKMKIAFRPESEDRDSFLPESEDEYCF